MLGLIVAGCSAQPGRAKAAAEPLVEQHEGAKYLVRLEGERPFARVNLRPDGADRCVGFAHAAGTRQPHHWLEIAAGPVGHADLAGGGPHPVLLVPDGSPTHYGPPIKDGVVLSTWAGFEARYTWRGPNGTVASERRFLGLRLEDGSLAVDVLQDIEPRGNDLAVNGSHRGSIVVHNEGDPAPPGWRTFTSEGAESGHARWIAASATDCPVVAILDHPENGRYPSWKQASSGAIGCDPWGGHSTQDGEFVLGGAFIEAGDGFARVFHRCVVLPAGADAEDVEAAWRAWVETFPKPPSGVVKTVQRAARGPRDDRAE